ncbi:tetratricopeptide repeat protein [Bosea sp. MMO-172]|uniref:tetratricopeptide repeat protein n=1 Tax=Bosea sp. MMO-172 TaxID=3127885 RepID=UPI003016F4C4
MAEGADDPGRLDVRAAAIIRAGLDRVLVSDAFRAAPQLSAFLSFVVERTVEGRAAELKGYTIAVEGLGRPADFNPQLDPIVRVEAGRLRRALAQYYAGDGRDDPVQISMPVGGYVPVFTWFGGEGNRAVPDASDEALEPDRRTALRWAGLTVTALAVGLLALGWWYLAPPRDPVMTEAAKPAAVEQAAASRRDVAAMPQLVRVAITIPDPPSDPRLADILRRFSALLVDAMVRFDDLVTIKAPLPGSALADEVDYVFEIDVQAVEGGAEGFGRLRSVRDGRIVWTTSSSRPSLTALQESELAEMARRLATRLTEPFGIILADARQFLPSPAIRCILKAFDARRAMLPEMRQASRSCLAKLVEQDPGFYPGWASLAIMTMNEYDASSASLTAAQPDDAVGTRPPLDRALAAAVTAIRLAPSGARAYQAMMRVLLLRGATEEAVQMGREAQARNPYDPEILADVGSVFIRLDRPLEGLPLLERATALSVARPPRYDFYAFLGAYLVGAGKVSETHAGMLAADTSQFSLLGQALKAAADKDPEKQAKVLAQLVEKSPHFGQDPRTFLERRGFSRPVVDRLLTALGLDKP